MTISGKILVIVDVNHVGELIETAATDLGLHWEPITDISGLPEKLTPDTGMILLDPSIAKTNIQRVMQELRARNSDAEIVLLGSDNDPAVVIAERLAVRDGLGIIGHLQKPFPPTALKALLRKHAWQKTTTPAPRDPGIDVEEQEVRDAIRQNQFVLHYRPQIEVASGGIAGIEGLARWRHPQRGLIFPDSFLGGLRSVGLFPEFDRLILDRGLSELKIFAKSEPQIRRFTLRVTVDSLTDTEFPATFASLTTKHGVPAHHLLVAFPGRGMLETDFPVQDVLLRLRMNNVGLSVGDYESGFVRIQQLREISANELRIDRTFIQNMLTDERDRTMVEKIILIAHELGMTTLAEGVETVKQFEFLRSKGCDFAQGYLFTHALHPEHMAEWLKSYQPLRRYAL